MWNGYGIDFEGGLKSLKLRVAEFPEFGRWRRWRPTHDRPNPWEFGDSCSECATSKAQVEQIGCGMGERPIRGHTFSQPVSRAFRMVDRRRRLAYIGLVIGGLQRRR